MHKKSNLSLYVAMMMTLILLMSGPCAALAEPAVSQWAKDNHIDDPNQTVEELYELAKQEGKVIFYSVSSRAGKVAESFMAQYPGITVEAYDLSRDELIEKVSREYEAGVYNTDIVQCQDLDGSVYIEKVLNGVFHNYFPADITASISDPKLMEFAMPLYWELNQWFYSSALFDAPPVDSWWDLTREEWRGNLIMRSPIASRNDLAILTSFLQYEDEVRADYEREFGEPLTEYKSGKENAAYELIYRLFKNDVVFASTSDEVCESVAGANVVEKKLGYGVSSKLRKNKENNWTLAPINILPSTGIPNPVNLYIVDQAPHPNAAKLFLRWICGETDGQGEGFKPFNTLGGWSVRDNVPVPEGATPLKDLNVWNFDPMFIYDHINDMEDFLLTVLN